MAKSHRSGSSGSASGTASTPDSYRARSTASLPTDHSSSCKALDSIAEPMSLAQKIKFDERQSKTAAYVRHLERLEELRVSQQPPSDAAPAIPALRAIPPLSTCFEHGGGNNSNNSQQSRSVSSSSHAAPARDSFSDYLRLDFGDTISFEDFLQPSPGCAASDEADKNAPASPTTVALSQVATETRDTRREDKTQLPAESPGHGLLPGNHGVSEPLLAEASGVDESASERVGTARPDASDSTISLQSGLQHQPPSESVKEGTDDAPTIHARSDSAIDLSSSVIPAQFRMSVYGRRSPPPDRLPNPALPFSELPSPPATTLPAAQQPERTRPSSSTTQLPPLNHKNHHHRSEPFSRPSTSPSPPPLVSPIASPSPVSPFPPPSPRQHPITTSYELSTSASVIHKPRPSPRPSEEHQTTKTTTTPPPLSPHARPRYRNLKIYNTLPGEAFPIFSTSSSTTKMKQKRPSTAAAGGGTAGRISSGARGGGGVYQDPAAEGGIESVANDDDDEGRKGWRSRARWKVGTTRRSSLGEDGGEKDRSERLALALSIEPVIDPRTGRRWVGSFG